MTKQSSTSEIDELRQDNAALRARLAEAEARVIRDLADRADAEFRRYRDGLFTGTVLGDVGGWLQRQLPDDAEGGSDGE